MRVEEFNIFNPSLSLEISVDCDVIVMEGPPNQIKVEANGSKHFLEALSMEINPDGYPGPDERLLVVSTSEVREAQNKKAAIIKVFAPKGFLLGVDLAGNAFCVCVVEVGKAILSCEHSSRLTVMSAKSVILGARGKAKAKIQQVSGSLIVECHDAAEIEAKGEFKSVKVNGSGSSLLKTFGTCNGNYFVNGLDSFKFEHEGEIKGKAVNSSQISTQPGSAHAGDGKPLIK